MGRTAHAILALALATALTGCFEPQPAPELPTSPSSEFQLQTVVDGLEHPWAAAALPGGGYLVTGKLGMLWRVEAGTVHNIENLPIQISDFSGQRAAEKEQGGLLDVALAPDFMISGEIYLSYSYGNWGANGTALLRARLDGDRIVSSETIFSALPAKEAGSHFGGKILFLRDGTLLLSLGDGFALREEAQKTSSHLGSIVRLTREGGSP